MTMHNASNLDKETAVDAGAEVLRITKTVDSLYSMGVSARERRQSSEVQTLCEAISAINPTDTRAYFLHASTKYDAMQFAAADDLYHKVLEIDQNVVWARMVRGFIARDEGRTFQSIEHFRSVTTLEPGLQQAYFELGGAYAAARQFDLALKAFRGVQRTSSGYWTSVIEKTEAFERQLREEIRTLVGDYRQTQDRSRLVQISTNLIEIGKVRCGERLLRALQDLSNSEPYVLARLSLLSRRYNLNAMIDYLLSVESVSYGGRLQSILADLYYQTGQYKECEALVKRSTDLVFSAILLSKIAMASNGIESFRNSALDLIRQTSMPSILAYPLDTHTH